MCGELLDVIPTQVRVGKPHDPASTAAALTQGGRTAGPGPAPGLGLDRGSPWSVVPPRRLGTTHHRALRRLPARPGRARLDLHGWIVASGRTSPVARSGNIGYFWVMKESAGAARLLRQLREQRGTTLRAAAEDLGVAPSHLSRWERGEKAPSGELRQRAAKYYDIDEAAIELEAGRVPADIVEIFKKHPEVLPELRRRFPP